MTYPSDHLGKIFIAAIVLAFVVLSLELQPKGGPVTTHRERIAIIGNIEIFEVDGKAYWKEVE